MKKHQILGKNSSIGPRNLVCACTNPENMNNLHQTPLEKTYSTTFLAEYFSHWLKLPEKLKGALTIDVGGGGSNLSQYLRARGADAHAVDPRYSDDLNPLLESVRGKLGLSPQDLDLDSFWGKVRAYFMKDGSNYEKNQYAFERMLADYKRHPEKYLVGRADSLPFEDNVADYVHSLEAVSAFLMNDVTELRNSVRDMVRVLKPGGTLQITPWPNHKKPWCQWEPEQVENANQVRLDLESSVQKWHIAPSPYAETDLLITK